MADSFRQSGQSGDPTLVRWADADIRPIPDPTKLTNELVIQAEIRIDAKIQALRELLEVRINDVQHLMENEIETTNKLKEEKFAGSHREFAHLEDMRREQKRDAEINLQAALQSAKEATNTSADSLKEQLIQLRVTAEATATGLRRDIDGNKETILSRVEANRSASESRMYGLENRLTSVEQQKVGAKDNTAWIVGIAATFVAMLAIMGWVASHNVQPQQAPITVTPPPGSGPSHVEVR